MRWRPRPLDLASMVNVAARATGRDPVEVAGGAEVTLLVFISERVRSTPTRCDAAAEVLVGVAAGRPFDRGNAQSAWALAVYVLSRGRRRAVHIDPDDAVELVRAAAAGRIREAAVAARLRAAVGGRGVDPTTAGFFRFPQPPTPAQWVCPACGRSVRVAPWRSSVFLLEPLPNDVIRDCATTHRSHPPVVARRPFRLRLALDLDHDDAPDTGGLHHTSRPTNVPEDPGADRSCVHA